MGVTFDHPVLFCPHSEIPRINLTTGIILDNGEAANMRMCNMCEHTLYQLKQPIRVKEANSGETYRVEYKE